MRTPLALVALCALALPVRSQDRPIRIYISVDMEGIGGIGTPAMTSGSGKDYALGRELMTEEVNAVVETIFAHGPAEVLVNDSHGDMQNLLHTRLDPRVEYIQGSIKPFGMVQGLDASFDAAMFIGYHARAGTEGGFLAHTGSGSVKGVWIDGTEVGEGGMNAYYAGSLGVPVVLASGDATFALQIADRVPGVHAVATKTAETDLVARLVHPDVVRERLREATADALEHLDEARPIAVDGSTTIRMRFASTTRPDIAMAIPGTRRVDGYTVEWDAADMAEGYAMIRLLYKFISW